MGVRTADSVIDKERVLRLKHDCDEFFDLTRLIFKSPKPGPLMARRSKSKSSVRQVAYDLCVGRPFIAGDEILDAIIHEADMLILRLAILTEAVDKDNEWQVSILDDMKELAWKLVQCVEIHRERKFFKNNDSLHRYLTRM